MALALVGIKGSAGSKVVRHEQPLETIVCTHRLVMRRARGRVKSQTAQHGVFLCQVGRYPLRSAATVDGGVSNR